MSVPRPSTARAQRALFAAELMLAEFACGEVHPSEMLQRTIRVTAQLEEALLDLQEFPELG